jgi:hypothetical protein
MSNFTKQELEVLEARGLAERRSDGTLGTEHSRAELYAMACRYPSNLGGLFAPRPAVAPQPEDDAVLRARYPSAYRR